MIQEALDRAEASTEQGKGLKGTGFWSAVNQLRSRPEEAAAVADRVARIDRKAFESSVKLRVPVWLGNLVLGGGTLAGVAALVASGRLEDTAQTIAFLIGFGILDVSTHSLAHYLVGRLVGIRFTHYFLGGPPPPRPGAKVDYASYLRTPPRRRALMHASGAVVTKLVPFALIPVALAQDVWGPVILVLSVAGVGQILTDVLFSTKTSDWKKVRREMEAERKARTGGE